MSWESLLKQKDSLPAVNDMRRVERLHHKTISDAYIVAAVADAPPRSLPHDQHVHLCLYRARGVQRLPAPVCRFPVGVTVERMVEKFSIVLRTDMVIAVMVHLTLCFISNQIKSNHFYCHITTAQVPWWVKFLWACSRQCRKTTDNLHMDRQCKKKTTNNLHMDRQCKKLHWSIYSAPDSAKKTTTAIYIWTDSAKKTTAIYIWTDSAKKTTAIYIWTDSAKKTTAIYIWTVHIYRLYRRQCAKYTYIYSVRLVYYRDILNYQRHIIHRMGTSTLCTVSIHNVVYT